MTYRNGNKIFLLREVFNTSVDKRVENGGFSTANYRFLSSLKRIAPFGCKKLCSQKFHGPKQTRIALQNLFPSRNVDSITYASFLKKTLLIASNF
jgi:hypothetical protein